MDLGIPGIGDAVEVGSGGAATVYRASQDHLGRDVAVKVLNVRLGDGSTDERRRFEREQLAMGRLADRPGVVPVYDSGLTPLGQPYLIMPFYPNGSLQDRLDNHGPVPPNDAVALIVPVANAVDLAHRDGIFHRDIKPGNIMITRDGQAVIGDFGIARLVDSTTLFHSQTLSTTPAFSAPEVFADADPSAASDVYSLGATLFALVSGSPAFVSVTGEGNVLALMRRIETEPLPDLRDRGIPGLLAETIEWAMAKDPVDRPSSAAQLAESLTCCVTATGASPIDTKPAAESNDQSVADLQASQPEPPSSAATTQSVSGFDFPPDEGGGAHHNRPTGSVWLRAAVSVVVVAAALLLLVMALGGNDGDNALSDCIPDDVDGDGRPDGNISSLECAVGEGGSLPDSLSSQQVVVLLDFVYQRLPDTTKTGEEPDGFPNIPRRIENGVDLGPNWDAVVSVLAEPGARDLGRLLDDRLARELLAFDDINNREFTNP